MDEISKFLKKLSAQEYEALMLVYLQIQKDYSKIPGVIKLAGHKDLYRVRVGRIRIIFKLNKQSAAIIKITFRNESTYKNL